MLAQIVLSNESKKKTYKMKINTQKKENLTKKNN